MNKLVAHFRGHLRPDPCHVERPSTRLALWTDIVTGSEQPARQSRHSLIRWPDSGLVKLPARVRAR